MPKYMIRASYTVEGVKGLLKDGGTARMKAVETAVRGVGGKVEGFYFAFGHDDAIVIVDVPDAESAAALSLAVSASGAVATETTVLLTPTEMDGATKKAVPYRAPGR